MVLMHLSAIVSIILISTTGEGFRTSYYLFVLLISSRSINEMKPGSYEDNFG